MPQNFHEHLERPEVNPPSERSTGLVFAAVAGIVAVLHRGNPTVLMTAGGISAALAAASLLAPRLLRPLNLLWFRLGLVLHRIVNPLVMGLLFYGVVTPAGFFMRLLADPLNCRGAPQRQVPRPSFWTERRSRPASMKNQF